MHITRAIVRRPPMTFASGLTSDRGNPPVLARATVQHRRYCQALASCGVTLTTLPEDSTHPDSCFVEDTAIVTARGAVGTWPGAPSRVGEVDSVLVVLERWYGQIPRIAPPATLDGGDVCEADGHFLIGLSRRTNEHGAQRLAEILERLGYRSSVVDIRKNPQLLHLKSGLSYVGDGRLVVVPEISTIGALRPYELIVVTDAERYAANCVRVNDRVLIAAGQPRFAARLSDLGYDTIPLDLSEFRKMDGALTCLSLRF
jgi:dimethylargininase